MSAPRAKLGRLRIRLKAGAAGIDSARALRQRLERDLASLSPQDWARLARTPRIEADAADGEGDAARAVSRALRGTGGEGRK